MCRYAMYGPYKSHFACFACRKAFKQPPIVEWLALQGLDYAYEELARVVFNPSGLIKREAKFGIRLDDLHKMYAAHPCPQCGETMADMGLDFKAPKQSAVKAWRFLQGMYRVGHAFHTCGCDGPGWIPKANRDYKLYLENRRQWYSKQLNLVQQASDKSAEEKLATGNYWSERIATIDSELQTLSG